MLKAKKDSSSESKSAAKVISANNSNARNSNGYSAAIENMSKLYMNKKALKAATILKDIKNSPKRTKPKEVDSKSLPSSVSLLQSKPNMRKASPSSLSSHQKDGTSSTSNVNLQKMSKRDRSTRKFSGDEKNKTKKIEGIEPDAKNMGSNEGRNTKSKDCDVGADKKENTGSKQGANAIERKGREN